MSRITDKDLESLAGMINRATGSPTDSYRKRDDGKFESLRGHFHISHAYGGVCLHRMVNEGGGVRDVFSCGHVTKRELYVRMNAYLDGLQDARVAA